MLTGSKYRLHLPFVLKLIQTEQARNAMKVKCFTGSKHRLHFQAKTFTISSGELVQIKLLNKTSIFYRV
jgi:hypothetical protein